MTTKHKTKRRAETNHTRRTLLPCPLIMYEREFKPKQGFSLDCFYPLISPLQDWFAVEDEEFVLDVPGSFARRDILSIVLKFLGMCYVSFALVYSMLNSNSWEAYFGDLTGVALFFSVGYMVTSLGNSLFGVNQPRRLERVSQAVRVQWFMFNLAIHATVLSVALWWSSQFNIGETTLTLENVSTHGGTLIVLALEGFLVCRIPIRFYFWWGTCLPVVLGYLAWTYVQAVVDIGDLDDEVSDSLYKFFDWQDDFVWAVIASVLSIFGVSPFVQLMLSLISRYGFTVHNIRRYIDEEALCKSDSSHPNNNHTDSDLEER